MINNARVKVINAFPDKSIRVLRKPTKSTSDFKKSLKKNSFEIIDLQSLNVSLVIHAPDKMDIKKCQMQVDAAVDLEVHYSRSDSTWTFKIAPNDLEPEIPTTVNISVGDIQPE